ncbi:uncharacterized protein LOC128237695 [Mya arenaria]|uniref:uncharacterized protein LOC128237695 n=1 Tax=Mya arenaria TaxID=6604 RepID=UPI0022E95C6C|nr:uncharacterized protein LOC128237695 [Mya arenaria]
MTSRQTQTGFPLCERCCFGTICNMNMCGQAPNISVSGGPTCYSCSNHTTKDSCTDIQHCPAGQVCQLVPKISIATHTYHFESSCAVHADCEAKVAALTQGILGRKRASVKCPVNTSNASIPFRNGSDAN